MSDGFEVANGEMVLLENCRFNVGEKKNKDETAPVSYTHLDVYKRQV